MTLRNTVVAVAFAALVAVALLLVVGQVIGQPVLLSYVETGSMRPQLQPGDGFVAVPAVVAGDPDVGDVIVFDAVTLNGGDLVTHRIIAVTDEGYITQGDANPVDDQSAGEPPVTDDQIVAEALQVGGDIVVVPRLGVVVVGLGSVVSGVGAGVSNLFSLRGILGPQGASYALFGVGILLYVVTTIRESASERHPSRRTRRSVGRFSGTLVVVALTVVVVATVTVGMTAPSETHTFTFVSSQSDAPGTRVIEHGTTEKVAFQVPSHGALPVVVFLEPSDPSIRPDVTELYVPANAVRTVPVEIDAPRQTGLYSVSLTERRYIAVLPSSTIRALYLVHPWLPIVVVDVLVGVGFLGLGFGLIGGGPIRIRSGRESDGIGEWFR